MAIEIRDGDNVEKYMAATGAGTSGDPYIPTHGVNLLDSSIVLPVEGDPAGEPIPSKIATDANDDDIQSNIVTKTSTVTGLINFLLMGGYNTSAPAPANGDAVTFQVDSAGNLKIVAGIPGTTPTETSVSVTTSTTQLLAANASRTRMAVKNSGPYPIWVAADGNSAVADDTGFKLDVTESWIIPNGNTTRTSVNAISLGGTSTVHVMEAS